MPNLYYRSKERGEGRLKFLITLAIIAGVVYIGMQFLPVYLHYIQMQDSTKEIVRQAALQNLSDNDVHARLVQKAVEYRLPDDAKIDIKRNGKKVVAQIAYTQIIELPGYTYRWPFRIHEEETGF
jgi:hypothetical protein